jgi:hypothetical protein
MQTNQKSVGAIGSLSLMLALAGATGCSNDNPSDSTPDLFTPAAGTTQVTAPLHLYSVPEAPMPSKGATLYLIGLKMNLDSLGMDADYTRNEIVDCFVTISYGGQDLVSDSSPVDAQGASPCRAGDKPDDLGVFLVGTGKKSGSMTFSIAMHNVERKVTVRGSTTSIPVQPGGTVTQDLIAKPVP